MSQDLVSLQEAARSLGVSVKTIKNVIEKGQLKVAMRGNLALVSLSQARRSYEKLKMASYRKGAIARQKELIDHLKVSVEHLREENKELREERRLAQARADRLLWEVTKHRLGEAETSKSTIDVRQGASAKQPQPDLDLDRLCQSIDAQRGVASKPTPSRRRRWRDLFLG